LRHGEQLMDPESFIARLVNARVSLPEHVVYREFPAETVMLNLETEQYYGLNSTAGAMLASLAQTGEVAATVEEMVERFQRPTEEIERDLAQLCDQLSERGLIEVTSTPQA
jgi:Coenzyme PQQ synthesis protein D (PqqD)